MLDVIKAIANFLLFQLAWFAAIIGAAHGWSVVGSIPALAVVAIHLGSNLGRWKSETLLVLGVTLLGAIVETVFVATGALHYAAATDTALLPPIWIVALWFAFGTLPHGSLQWLSGKTWLQLVLGGVFAPLSYLGGIRLGAATLGTPAAASLAVIGCGWALAVVVVFKMADRLKGGFQKISDF